MRRFLMMFGSNFSPKSISNLAFWHDPSNAGSVTLNVTDVSQINDLSPNGNNASQGTAAAQPAYTTGAILGKSVIGFTGANNDALNFPAGAVSLTRNVTGFSVCGVVRIPTLGSTERIFTALTNPGTTRLTAGFTAGNGLVLSTRRLDADTVDNKTSSNTVGANTATFFFAGVDYINAAVRLQLGATITTAAVSAWAGGGNSDDTNSSSAPNYGRSAANILSGDLGECAGWNRILGAGEVSEVYNYFKGRWGV